MKTFEQRQQELVAIGMKVLTGQHVTVDELRDFDPIASVEALGIERGSEQYDMSCLSMAMLFNPLKTAALVADDDSAFSGEMGNMRRLLALEGFELIHTHNFENMYDGEMRPETNEFYWNRADGVLFLLESYGTTRMNTAIMYYQWKGEGWPNVRGSGGLDKMVGHDGYVWVGYIDARESFRHTLKTLRESGELLAQWGVLESGKTPWLWLCNYVDTKDEGYDHKAITASRVAQFPEYVRKAMNR